MSALAEVVREAGRLSGTVHSRRHHASEPAAWLGVRALMLRTVPGLDSAELGHMRHAFAEGYFEALSGFSSVEVVS